MTKPFFNGKFYHKIDEVAIDSPLASVLTNIFMGYPETEWLNEYSHNKKICLRYVDDFVSAFGKGQDSLYFLD